MSSENLTSYVPSMAFGNTFGYKESKPIINYVFNKSRDFLQKQSRHLVIIIFSYWILQKMIPIIIFDIILSRILRKRSIKRVSIGFFIFNFFTRIKVLFKNGGKLAISKLKIQRKLIDESGKKSLLIDFIDINLSFPKLSNSEKKVKEVGPQDKEENQAIQKCIQILKKLENLDLKVFFKNKFIALFIFKIFFPIQFSLQKVRLNFGSVEFYADYISIRLSYNKKTQKIIFSFFVHELNNYKNMTLKNFEYEIEAEWSHDKKNHILSFGNYSSSIKIADLNITSKKSKTDKEPSSVKESNGTKKGVYHNNEEIIRQYGESYTKICSYLKVVELKVEDIDINLPDMDLKFYCAAMTLRFNALSSQSRVSGYECTVSSNTIALQIYGQNVISLPLLNVYLVGDSLYDFQDIEHFKCNVKCIVNCIQSNIVISEKIINYFIYNFIRPGKVVKDPTSAKELSEEDLNQKKILDDEKLSLMLYLFDFFFFDFKIMIPNARITYLMDDSEVIFSNNQTVLHFKSPKNIYHLYDELLGGTNNGYNEELRLSQTMSSFKASDLVLTYKKYVEGNRAPEKTIQVLFIKKLELQNYQNNIFQFDNLISGTDIEIVDIEMIQELLDSSNHIKNYYVEHCGPPKVKVKKPNSFYKDVVLKRMNFKSRVYDFGFTNAFSKIIRKQLDPTGELFDKFYGFKGFIKSLEFIYSEQNPVINTNNIGFDLIQNIPDLLAETQKCASFDDVLIDLDPAHPQFVIDTCTLKTDLATVWTGFYLALAYKTLNFYKSEKKQVKEKKKTDFSFKINSILIDSLLVDDLNILFSLKDFEVSPRGIGIGLFQTYNESTYDPDLLEINRETGDEPIFTRLLYVNDIFVDTNKENIGNHLAQININTFELRSEYHLKFYTIFDRVVNTFKSLLQLKAGLSNVDSFIQKEPSSMGPIEIPPIKVKMGKFLIKVDEDPFEQKLNLIYKIGSLEQLLRLDKEAIFETELNEREGHRNWSSSQIQDAKYRLNKNFSTSWIERIKKARKEFMNEGAFNIVEKKFLGRTVNIYAGHEKIPLMVYSLINMEFVVKPPNFGVVNYADFIYDYGKKAPKDTIYTLLILLNVYLKCDLLNLQLRDYAIPIIFFPNMVLSGDLALGEPMPDAVGVREVWVPFIKNIQLIHPDDHIVSNVFASTIKRTINSLKFYMNLKIDIDSQQPTILTWGKSLQPAISAVMNWFDYLTKPPLDPSPKIGFWDKIRLLTHGIIQFKWSENSELHLNMKGSTDPYEIHEFGAGLTFCWKGNASLTIHENSDPADFLKIRSQSFILGVRNFDALYEEDKFSKIMMELNGNVLWRLGLMFEMGDLNNPGQAKRSTHFNPHYNIYLANPALMDNEEEILKHDSFKNFRSHFIHMDIGVYSNDKKISKNSLHLAPFCSEHFLAWWRLFDTFTSGPIRQGPLFPSLEQSTAKFGASLFTLKYQMNFTNLDMAHVYRHSSSENNNSDDILFTGLKGKFDLFSLDLHQKKSPVTFSNERLNRVRRLWKLKMDQGEVDFLNADIRLIHSVFKNNSGDETDSTTEEDEWYASLDYTDLDDFKELSSYPDFIETTPLLKSERISYFRDIENNVFKFDYPFGKESFHKCFAGKHDSEETQLNIYTERLNVLKGKIQEIGQKSKNEERLSHLNSQKKAVEELIEKFKPNMKAGIVTDSSDHVLNAIKDADINTCKNIGSKSTFDNRFAFHNMKLEVNEFSKKLLLNYVKKIEERKATSFYDSYSSLSVLKDLMEYGHGDNEVLKSNEQDDISRANYNRELDYHVKLDSMDNSECIDNFDTIIRSVADMNFFSSDNMVLKFIMPQIQLSSSTAPGWATMVLANEIEVGIIDILQGKDAASITKSVENLRETRICMLLSEVKMFTIDVESALNHPILKYEIEHSSTNNHSPIPFLPVESFICDKFLDKYKNFFKSSLYLAFTNPNELFYDKVSHMIYDDHPILRIGIPEIHMQVTKHQYSALYAIFDDMLTFGSKENKTWDSLATNFLVDELKKNFATSASFIMSLQKKIRAIRMERSIMKDNDPDAFEEIRDAIEKELDTDRYELRLLISSLKKNFSVSKKKGGKNELSKVYWYISADDLICDLYDDPEKPFITLGLGFSSFERSSFSDGSNANSLMLSTLHCFSLDKSARYGEIISPLKEFNTSHAPLLELIWKMDKPVGGLTQINAIDVELRPLRLQIEKETLDKIIHFLLDDHNKTADKERAEDEDNANMKKLENVLSEQNQISLVNKGLTEMVSRSSKYMAIKRVVIHKTVLSVSFRGSKKITNLNDLIVKIPVLKYENKVWSNDDFIAALKKDLIKVVLSHTGNIIGNKFKTKKKRESRFESFKQFSKMLRSDSEVGRNSFGRSRDLDSETSSNQESIPSISEIESIKKK